jgi:nitrogen fixation/metabolism regulation signal transduction histidine kinase
VTTGAFSSFSLARSLAWRAALVGALAAVFVLLALRTELYASMAVLLITAFLLCLDMARVISRAMRASDRYIDSLGPDSIDAVLPAPLAGSVGRWRSARAAQQQELDAARALLDPVNAAVLVVDASDRVTYMNRAARAWAREPVDRLEQIPALGGGAALLAAMQPGTREIARFADGEPVYVACSRYSGPGLGEQRLIAIQRIAGDLDAVEVKAWTDMARVLAHEMMNSLTPIASLSESLEHLLRDATGVRASSAEQELAAALEAIKRRSLGLMNFVERYRAVAELPEPARQPIRARDFLAGIEKLMSATFRERQIEFSARVDPPDLELNADPELMEQALINLLRNAVDAVAQTAAPRVAVEIRVSDGGVTMEVHDNGLGLPDAVASHVFTPFFTTKPGGSGIGLNVARHVALAHGGQLDVRRGASGGAVFSLVFPTA